MDQLYLTIGLSVLALLIAIFLLTRDCDRIMVWYLLVGQRPEKLKGKVIWIVGASSGIGAALAIKLAKCGAKLVLSATRQSNLDAVKVKCLEANSKLNDLDILVLPLDVADISSHWSALNSVLERFEHLDILVNNAGKYQVSLFIETEHQIDRANFDINVLGPISLARTVAQSWVQKNQKGHLVVTSSILGRVPGPTTSTYTATKTALHGYYDSLAIELFSKGIRVSVVCPGPTDTELFSNSMTGKLGVTGQPSPPLPKMSSERCAHLYSVAIANNVSEAWLCVQPMILSFYFATTFRTLYKLILRHMASEYKLREFMAGRIALRTPRGQ